jgi:tRNA(Arg) A34 adenosine deaminase TadA
MGSPTERELAALRDAIGLSEASRRLGNMPFGAVLLAPDGTVLAAAQNTVVTGRDLTGHAEINVLRAASATCSAQQIAAATMVASGEPCPMCSGAMIRLGICRVVFGIRAALATPYLPASAGVLAAGLSCRDILRLAPAVVEVMGPVLEDEARLPFEALSARGAG